MNELVIKDINWNTFLDGDGVINHKPTIICEIPNGLNPMSASALKVDFMVKGLSANDQIFVQNGYHVCKNELILSCFKNYRQKSDKLKAYTK